MRSSALLAPVLLAFPAALAAQDLALPFRAPAEQRNHFSVGFALTSGYSVDFRNVGRVPAPTSPAIGTAAGVFQYVDGYVAPDSQNPADGFTSNFSYVAASQRSVDGNGDNLLRFNNYGSAFATDVAGEDSGVGLGWELRYVRDLGGISRGRMKWGVITGFTATGSDAAVTEDLTGALLTVTDTFNFGAEPIPDLPTGGGAYVGPVTRPLTDPTLAPSNPVSRTETTTADEATVRGSYGVDASFYNFRVGPSLQVPFGERFGMTASAGVAATYLATRFTSRQTLLGENDTILSTLDESTSTGDFVVGAYAEAQGWFRINRSLSVYSGFSYLGTSGDARPTIGEKFADVDVSGTVSANAGFRFSF